MNGKMKIFALAGLSFFASLKTSAQADNQETRALYEICNSREKFDENFNNFLSAQAFVEKYSSKQKINEDSIYGIPDLKKREEAILKLRSGLPTLEIDTVPAQDYKETCVGQSMIHGGFQEELNRIKMIYFDMSKTFGLSVAQMKFLEAANRELPLNYWHEFKHYLDRLRKNLGGCDTRQIVQYEIFYELLGTMNRLVIGREIYRKTGNMGAAFPEAVLCAAKIYSEKHPEFRWNDFDLDNAPYLLNTGEIRACFGAYREYVEFLASSRELKDKISKEETDSMMRTVIAIAKESKDFYLKHQLTARRFEIDLRDKLHALKNYGKAGGAKIVGYDALLDGMFSDCFVHGGMNLMDSISEKVRKDMFDFVKDCAKKDFILKRVEEAETTFAKVIHLMSVVQNSIGINPDAAEKDIFHIMTKMPEHSEKSR
ncbi:MAG: hypothetical protein LBD50_02905 [Rickettsiales bacterium]|jgi:hypothetical protein|nr:hypothetical protein [Rickettsiales bacterium]